MGLLQWFFDYVCNPVVQGWTKVWGWGKDCKAWVQRTHQAHRWIWTIVKWIFYLLGLVGTIYFGIQGIAASRRGNQLARKSLQLSAMQYCVSDNLSEEDQYWWGDSRKNLPLDTIMDAVTSAVLATRDYLNLTLAAFGLCSVYPAIERNGDTCITIGALLLYLAITGSVKESSRATTFFYNLLGALSVISSDHTSRVSKSVNVAVGLFCGGFLSPRLPTHYSKEKMQGLEHCPHVGDSPLPYICKCSCIRCVSPRCSRRLMRERLYVRVTERVKPLRCFASALVLLVWPILWIMNPILEGLPFPQLLRLEIALYVFVWAEPYLCELGEEIAKRTDRNRGKCKSD